jgi:hypothetical protein
MNFTDATITKYAQEGENILANDSHCIQERVAIAAVVGQSEYTLPDTVIGITRVTWKGYKLDPYSGPEMRWSNSTPGSTISNHPLYYIFSDVGFRGIKLYPSPQVALAVPPGDLWSDNSIANGLIVQYTSNPSFISSSVRIPSVFRRQILKDYISHRCFMRAGKSMDQKASQYFAQKFADGRAQNKEAWKLLFQSVVNVKGDSQTLRYPAHPVLPSNFGTIVEE